VYDTSLGLRPPGRGCQLHSGIPPGRMARLALRASANSLVSSNRVVGEHYTVICQISNIKSERFPGCYPLFWNYRISTWVSQ
jgi:hypothetical protein